MMFDVIIANPPFNKPRKNKNNGVARLYDKFIQLAIDIVEDDGWVGMITPANWINNRSPRTKKLRRLIMENGLIKIKTNIDKYFKGIKVVSNICYYIQNKGYEGEILFNEEPIIKNNYDLLVTNKEIVSILDKIHTSTKRFMDKDYKKPEYINSGKYKRLSKEPFENSIPVVGPGIPTAKDSKVRYINKNKVDVNKFDIDKWKIGSTSNGSNGRSNRIIQIISRYLVSPKIIEPGYVSSQSIIYFSFETKEEAENCWIYLELKLPRLLRYLAQDSHNYRGPIFQFIPSLDQTVQWDDEALYEHFNLSPEEIKFIEENV